MTPAEELILLEYYQNVLVSQGKKLKFPDRFGVLALRDVSCCGVHLRLSGL